MPANVSSGGHDPELDTPSGSGLGASPLVPGAVHEIDYRAIVSIVFHRSQFKGR
jgi:hypothetical protein